MRLYTLRMVFYVSTETTLNKGLCKSVVMYLGREALRGVFELLSAGMVMALYGARRGEGVCSPGLLPLGFGPDLPM